MHILVSAFACSPGLGSDQAVGWGWAEELCRRGHAVCVITRANHRDRIEAARVAVPGLTVVYYDIPWLAHLLSPISRRNHLYYYFWQWGAYRLARRLHANQAFDLVHHVTWVSLRQPSFMGGLGIPFIFGPVAGGESAPYALRSGYGFKGWLRDWLRDLANGGVKFDPLLRRTFAQAARIVVTSEDTRRLIPRTHHGKTLTRLGIALPQPGSEAAAQDAPREPAGPFRLLFVGRFLDWKGMHLGLAAFARLVQRHPQARLTLVGRGPAEAGWRALAGELGVAHLVDWVPWMDQAELPALFRQHDIFLFPSLQDSGGLVVLEAMAQGLPAVALNLGGPGSIVDASSGIPVEARAAGKAAVIDALAAALDRMASDPPLRLQLAKGARARAEAFQWSRLADEVYDGFELPARV